MSQSITRDQSLGQKYVWLVAGSLHLVWLRRLALSRRRVSYSLRHRRSASTHISFAPPTNRTENKTVSQCYQSKIFFILFINAARLCNCSSQPPGNKLDQHRFYCLHKKLDEIASSISHILDRRETYCHDHDLSTLCVLNCSFKRWVSVIQVGIQCVTHCSKTNVGICYDGHNFKSFACFPFLTHGQSTKWSNQ